LSGSINYIWNQASAPQAGGFNISGNGLIGGNLLMGTETPSARLNVTGALPFSGTGSLSSSDTTVTGTGTMFTNELHVGDVLIVGDKKRIIGAIVSDTELITLTAFDPILTDSIYQYQQPVASFATQSGNSALFVSAEGNVGIKTAIPTKELEVSGTIKAAGFIGDGIIPKGLISMWSGSIAGIPSGWALCDGTNGTPDLRDRFIVGAGSNYSVGVTGGEATHTLNIAEMPSHGHTASSNSTGDHTHNIDPPNTGTSTNGNHSHTQKETRIDVGAEKIWPSCFPEDGGACVWRHYVDLASYNGNHSHTIDIGSFNSGNNGNHSHTITVNNTGGGQAHENRPPYYALAYIMKL
jgi:microcystin-dependent protein